MAETRVVPALASLGVCAESHGLLEYDDRSDPEALDVGDIRFGLAHGIEE